MIKKILRFNLIMVVVFGIDMSLPKTYDIGNTMTFALFTSIIGLIILVVMKNRKKLVK